MQCPLCENKTTILTDTIRGNIKRNVYFCSDCDLGVLDSKKIDYSKNYRKKHSPILNKETNPKELFEIYKNFQDDRIELIRPYLSLDKSLLELGCSAGMFLYNIKDYVKEIVGIDSDIASITFTANKCKCFTASDLSTFKKISPQTFDIICSFQTLEHIENPIEVLKEIKSLLNKDGIIYIEVPNLYDALRYVYDLPNHNKFYYHEAHKYYFSEKSLLKLMDMTGFKGKIFYTQDYNLLNHLHWIDTDTPEKDCIKGLSKPSLPFRKDINDDIKEGLNNILNLCDRVYKEQLIKLGISSNISFLGELK